MKTKLLPSILLAIGTLTLTNVQAFDFEALKEKAIIKIATSIHFKPTYSLGIIVNNLIPHYTTTGDGLTFGTTKHKDGSAVGASFEVLLPFDVEWYWIKTINVGLGTMVQYAQQELLADANNDAYTITYDSNIKVIGFYLKTETPFGTSNLGKDSLRFSTGSALGGTYNMLNTTKKSSTNPASKDGDQFIINENKFSFYYDLDLTVSYNNFFIAGNLQQVHSSIGVGIKIGMQF